MTPKLEHIILKYLNHFYGDLTKFYHPDFPGKVFYVRDKIIYMENRPGYDELWITKYYIWSDLELMFSLENDSIRKIIKEWVSQAYGITDSHPLRTFTHHIGLLS